VEDEIEDVLKQISSEEEKDDDEGVSTSTNPKFEIAARRQVSKLLKLEVPEQLITSADQHENG